ncbi:MAG: hypothetical protein ACRDWE_12800 [Acidimicrobiales bacterium]
MSPSPTRTTTDGTTTPGGPGGAGGGDGWNGNGHGALPPAPDDALSPWSRPKRPWYKSGVVIAVAAIVVIGGASVIADLPTKNTTSAQVAAMQTSLKAIDTGVHPCTYALSEAFSFLEGIRADTLTPSQRAQVPGFMKTDVQACSLVSETEVNLSTITVPNTKAGTALGYVIKDIYLWTTSDAVAAMSQIDALISNPHDASAQKALDKQERRLSKDRAAADREVALINRDLGHANVPDPKLPDLPHPATAGSASSTA